MAISNLPMPPFDTCFAIYSEETKDILRVDDLPMLFSSKISAEDICRLFDRDRRGDFDVIEVDVIPAVERDDIE